MLESLFHGQSMLDAMESVSWLQDTIFFFARFFHRDSLKSRGAEAILINHFVSTYSKARTRIIQKKFHCQRSYTRPQKSQKYNRSVSVQPKNSNILPHFLYTQTSIKIATKSTPLHPTKDFRSKSSSRIVNSQLKFEPDNCIINFTFFTPHDPTTESAFLRLYFEAVGATSLSPPPSASSPVSLIIQTTKERGCTI